MANFTIVLTEDETNQVGRALSEQPFKDVATVIQKIIEQVRTQQQQPPTSSQEESAEA